MNLKKIFTLLCLSSTSFALDGMRIIEEKNCFIGRERSKVNEDGDSDYDYKGVSNAVKDASRLAKGRTAEIIPERYATDDERKTIFETLFHAYQTGTNKRNAHLNGKALQRNRNNSLKLTQLIIFDWMDKMAEDIHKNILNYQTYEAVITQAMKLINPDNRGPEEEKAICRLYYSKAIVEKIFPKGLMDIYRLTTDFPDVSDDIKEKVAKVFGGNLPWRYPPASQAHKNSESFGKDTKQEAEDPFFFEGEGFQENPFINVEGVGQVNIAQQQALLDEIQSAKNAEMARRLHRELNTDEEFEEETNWPDNFFSEDFEPTSVKSWGTHSFHEDNDTQKVEDTSEELQTLLKELNVLHTEIMDARKKVTSENVEIWGDYFRNKLNAYEALSNEATLKLYFSYDPEVDEKSKALEYEKAALNYYVNKKVAEVLEQKNFHPSRGQEPVHDLLRKSNLEELKAVYDYVSTTSETESALNQEERDKLPEEINKYSEEMDKLKELRNKITNVAEGTDIHVVNLATGVYANFPFIKKLHTDYLKGIGGFSEEIYLSFNDLKDIIHASKAYEKLPELVKGDIYNVLNRIHSYWANPVDGETGIDIREVFQRLIELNVDMYELCYNLAENIQENGGCHPGVSGRLFRLYFKYVSSHFDH